MPTKKLIKQAIETLNSRIVAMESDRNPQVIKMVTEMKAERQAFEAVLLAMSGDGSLLRTYL